MTIVGVVLIAVCLLVLPWAEFNSQYFLLPELTDNADDANGSSFGSSYVAGWCYLYGTLHTAALIDLIDDGADLMPFAFVATIGYLLCAVGAFIGPKYVPAPR